MLILFRIILTLVVMLAIEPAQLWAEEKPETQLPAPSTKWERLIRDGMTEQQVIDALDGTNAIRERVFTCDAGKPDQFPCKENSYIALFGLDQVLFAQGKSGQWRVIDRRTVDDKGETINP
jgi:hypothetical protein